MTDLTPPFSLIDEIRHENGHYLGYDIDGNFIIELAPEGAMALVHEHNIKAVGFMLPRIRGVLDAMGAFNDGFMTAGYAIGKGMGNTFQGMAELLKNPRKSGK